MKNLKKIGLILVLSAITLIGHAQNFKLVGKSQDLPDGTKLFLQILTTDQKLERTDSTAVKNDTFTFSGALKDQCYVAVLYTSNHSDQAMIWLEPKNLTISVKKGDFKNLAIKGSTASQEFQQFSAIMSGFESQQDSVQNIDTGQDSIKYKEKWDQYAKIQVAETEAGKNFVKTHPNSVVSAFVLSIFSTSWGKKDAEELYQNFGAQVKQSKPGQQISQFIGLSKEIKIGDKYVDFELSNVSGRKIKLSAIKGKYILLDFWGSWCGPCRAENPKLVKIYNQFKDKGFNILGVAAETDKKAWLEAIKKDQLPWENVTDVSGNRYNQAVMIYNIYSFPTNFLIDEKGIIIAKNIQSNELTRKLQELLP